MYQKMRSVRDWGNNKEFEREEIIPTLGVDIDYSFNDLKPLYYFYF